MQRAVNDKRSDSIVNDMEKRIRENQSGCFLLLLRTSALYKGVVLCQIHVILNTASRITKRFVLHKKSLAMEGILYSDDYTKARNENEKSQKKLSFLKQWFIYFGNHR